MHTKIVVFLKNSPKVHAFTDSGRAAMPIYFFTGSASLIKDIPCKPCLIYIYVDIALQRGEMKHPDDICTTILLHNVILFRCLGEYTVQAANCTFASNHFQSALVTLWAQTMMKANRPAPRIFTLLWRKLERTLHMPLVKIPNINFSKLLLSNATIFVIT